MCYNISGYVMKPIVGIIGRNDLSYLNKPTICVFENYRKAVINFGGNPILILPTQQVNYYEEEPKNVNRLTNEEKQMIINQLKLCSGIIMPVVLKDLNMMNLYVIIATKIISHYLEYVWECKQCAIIIMTMQI